MSLRGVVSKHYHIDTSIIYHIHLLYNIPFISFFYILARVLNIGYMISYFHFR